MDSWVPRGSALRICWAEPLAESRGTFTKVQPIGKKFRSMIEWLASTYSPATATQTSRYSLLRIQGGANGCIVTACSSDSVPFLGKER